MEQLGKLSRIALLLVCLVGTIVSVGCAEKSSSSPSGPESGSTEGGGEETP